MKEQFVRLAAAALRAERFTLVDIGCSKGFEPIWREFGDRFAGVGFDASASECRRLAAEEANPNVHYVAGFVDIPPDHPFAQREPVWPGNVGSFYSETSSAWTIELRAERLRGETDYERIKLNQWQDTELADPQKPIYAPNILAELSFADVDVLKIDTDGPDFRILNSFDGLFDQLGILAARLEVNMWGGISETEHTFHNTDRFMRRHGYELVRLDGEAYSKRALPARYVATIPTSTLTGRLNHADAFYTRLPRIRDDTLTSEKLIKLAAICSAWGQPDGAAEILLTFRDRLAPHLDVDAALDLLAVQAQPGVEHPLSYREYMARFQEDAPMFYPPPPTTWQPPSPAPRPKLFQRLQAAWHSVSDWTYIEKLMGDLKERRH